MDFVRYLDDPVAFIDEQLPVNELGHAWRLQPHQRAILRAAFAFDAEGRLPFDAVLYSCPKKSGKTALNAAITCWWAFTQEPPNDLLIVANDYEQAQGRVYKTLMGLIQRNPVLARSAEVTTKQIVLSNGSTITVLASEYAGAAGSNHGLTSWDELWGYMSESAHRLFEQLGPVPTRRNSIRFITTYAGWEGESDLLHALYVQGVGPEEHPDGQGERVHSEWPLYVNRDARLLTYWDHEPRMAWQGMSYYASQRRTMRPATYLQIHENRWTTSETRLITPELWDGCVDHARMPLPPTKDIPLFVGVDASVKSDTSAIVALSRESDPYGEWYTLRQHAIWVPTPDAPIDLERDLEAYLWDLSRRYRVQVVACDPWQLMSTAQRLRKAGVNVVEYAQTAQLTQRMGAALYESLKGLRLRLYSDATMREHALNVVGVEGLRGVRLAKERASRKIDSVVALSLALLAAMDTPVYTGPLCW
jgi:phage terminase large subunit-like protein